MVANDASAQRHGSAAVSKVTNASHQPASRTRGAATGSAAKPASGAMTAPSSDQEGSSLSLSEDNASGTSPPRPVVNRQSREKDVEIRLFVARSWQELNACASANPQLKVKGGHQLPVYTVQGNTFIPPSTSFGRFTSYVSEHLHAALDDEEREVLSAIKSTHLSSVVKSGSKGPTSFVRLTEHTFSQYMMLAPATLKV